MRIRHKLRASRDYTKTGITRLLDSTLPHIADAFMQDRAINCNVKEVYIGRYDSRGDLCIGFEDGEGCVLGQKYFNNANELLSFLEGVRFLERGF